ncbi:hypothetical protein GWK47_031955 [Chionoecetes opilio]|uniref:Uncharacterized protein n=1 Tax=Chionoecetes opilio TaxID=41210 RepID=A0A8J5D417_CHIOP|nr:hypothetical protein GWK47_031955 [Chionoecetes opilio]
MGEWREKNKLAMEYIQIVQRPPFSHRPYGLLRSPYSDHPTCSVLCHHPTAPHTHRSLIHLTRASWLAEVRAHMSRAGAALADADLEAGDRRTPSSLPFTPMGTEGLQVNIPEEFLARFARSDSRPDSPARPCSCTPPASRPSGAQVRRPRPLSLRRATSLQDLAARPSHAHPPVPLPGRGPGKRKQGRFEADFTTKLTKQLDLVAKGQQQKQQEQQETLKGQRQQQGKKSTARGAKGKLKAQRASGKGMRDDNRPITSDTLRQHHHHHHPTSIITTTTTV